METKEKKEKKPEYITAAGLKGRGWTLTMIKKFLKEPDKIVDNPYYRCADPMKLYEMKRIKRIEKRKTFIAVMEASAKRKESAAKAVETKMRKSIKFAENVEIKVPKEDFNKVVEYACESYNDWHQVTRYGEWNEYFEPVYPNNPDKAFIKRITTNYLRHECTSYEYELHKLFGKTGVQEAHDILQKRINDKILETYPELDKL